MVNSESIQGETLLVSPEQPLAGPSLSRWCLEGLRAGLFLRPRTGDHQPSPAQVTIIVVLLLLFIGGLGRLEVNGPATLNLRGWLAPWWGTSALLLLAWWTLPRGSREPVGKRAPLAGLVGWFVLSSLAVLPLSMLAWANYAAQIHGVLEMNPWWQWATFILHWFLMSAVVLVLTRRYGVGWPRLLVFAVGWILLSALSLWQFNDRPWWPDDSGAEADKRPRLILNQEAFEKQQQVWRQAVSGLAKERPGVIDVYGLVFAPYASEDVFLRESEMVADVLGERFDAQHRVLQLVNHATTLDTRPWATLLNLERTIQAIAKRMDREHDVIVIYLTSHGASNFKLAATHWPLQVEALSPETLRSMLDRAGIRNRVIAISACYSGGWIGPLASDSTLVMTAANAERTSYGCGSKSDLTYFGRAVFDEQLRQTYSFEQAFQAARPVIEEREKVAGKKDGYSDPQIRVGADIKPVLSALERRLARQAQTTVTAALR